MYRGRPIEEPPVDAIIAPHPIFHAKHVAPADRLLPCGEIFIVVVRMNRLEPAPAKGLLERIPRVLEPGRIEFVDRAFGIGPPQEIGSRRDQAAITSFALPQCP